MPYKVVLYGTDQPLPYDFPDWKSADDYIFLHQLHAYVTIEIKESEQK